jgi:D-aspartate ligase
MDINKHKFILLASYTANTLGQIRSLGEKGINPIAVLMHKNTFRIDKSKYISELYNVKEINEGLNLIIDKFGHEPNKPFLYTDRDDVVGLLDRRYDEIKEKFYFWNAGSQGRLNKFLNKEEQIKLAQACGFNVPKTEVVAVGEFPKTLTYPIFTKAVDSLSKWWKGQAFICENEQELRNAYTLIKDVPQIILQEYIDKQNEVPYEGISINGGKELKMLIKSVNYRFTKDSFGIYRHIEPFYDKELEEKIKRFISQINYTGVFEIEFIIDKKGIPYFLETNFRITQYNSAYTMFGVNFPYLYAKSILEGMQALGDISYSNERPFNVMSEFEDFRLSCLHGNVSLWQWIKDVQNTKCFQYYDKHDKAPFYWTIFSKIAAVFSKK